jgi:hypothetical protein
MLGFIFFITNRGAFLNVVLGPAICVFDPKQLEMRDLAIFPGFILALKRVYLIRAAAALTPRALPTFLKSI